MDCGNQHQSIDISDLSDLLYDLVDIHVGESTNLALRRVLQCIFTQVKNKNMNLGQKVFENLIAAMLATSNISRRSNSSKEYHQFVANVLACLQLQVRTFPSKESNSLLQHLWSLSLNTEKLHALAPQILCTLFDDFNRNLGLKECPELLKVIQQLIQSNKNKERQAAFFLMHKLEENFELNAVAEAIMCSEMQWSDYTAALEHLEEQQMPLNLITFLENIKSMHDFFPWLRILYLRLFQSENVLIVYETVKYIINESNISYLTDWNLLEEFLEATNRTQLYNVDDDKRTYPFFKNFVSKSQLELFTETLASVTWEWHSLPLWEWLGSIPSEEVGQLPYISKETLLKLASRIRVMEKSELQYMAQGLITNRFECCLDNMSLGDYLLFIETMYSRAIEYYSDHDRLKRKILNCDKIEAEIAHFTKARLAIIFNLKTPTFLYCDFLMVFMDKLRTLSKVHHGWLRFFLMPCIKHYGISVFYSNVYDVETSLILRRKDLKKLQQHLLEKLLCETDEEKSLVLELSVDLFVTNQIKDWNEIEKLQLEPLELLEQGGKLTFKHLCYLLGATHKRLKDENVLPAVVRLLKKFPCSNTARNIGTYATKHLTPEEQKRLSLDIIDYHIHGNNGEQFITSVDIQSDHVYGHKGVLVGILDSKVKVPLHQVIQGIIHCSTLSEDAWIEANYLVFYGFGSVSSLFMLYTFEQPEPFINEIVEELLSMTKKLSECHSNYFSNSKEHRVQFCIALALMYLGPKYECSDMLWSALYSQNDQFNIILMYEVIVAESLRNADALIERLHSLATLEPNQQLSLLSVTNIFLKLKWNTLKDDQIQKIIEIFLVLAMQEITQVRQFAKMILCKITEMCKEKGFCIPIVNTLLSSINVNFQSIVPQLEVRYLLPDIHFEPYLRGWELNMSNIKPIYLKDDAILHISKFRKAVKLASIENCPAKEQCANIGTIIDIYPKPDLATHQLTDNNNADLVVVAILIDNLATLNGLMGTCQALGIRTLIVKESIKLSLTTDHTLNIVQLNWKSLEKYLHVKKMDNYQVFFTQNTAQNTDYVDLSFAKRTILILSEHQYDLPENLKYISDKIVEIPEKNSQYSQKLLMFKYYKQYLAQE